MRTKIIQLLILPILFMIGVASCDDEEKYSLQLDKDIITIDLEGGGETINVLSNGFWEISEIPGWMAVSPISGEGSMEVFITVHPNDGNERRTTSLVFTCGDISRTLEVEQLSINELAPFIKLEQEAVYINILGSKQKIQLTTNRPWQITGVPSWVMIDPTYGEQSAELVIEVKENKLPEGRSASLTITADNARKTLEITQPGLKDVVRIPTLPMFSFEKVSYRIGEEYEIEAANLFVNPSIKNDIYLGNLLSHNAGSNIDIPFFTGYTFNPIDVYTTARIENVTTTFSPSREAQDAFVESIIDQNPRQSGTLNIDGGGIEYYTRKQLHTIGMINLGVKLDELASGYSFSQQEMTKSYGMIFSFKHILFRVGMDYGINLIKEKIRDNDLAKGVSYVSSISYGRIGLLIVESNVEPHTIKEIVSKVSRGEVPTNEEMEYIQSADITHVYFSNDHDIGTKKGGLEAITSYIETIKNTKENIYMVDFQINNFVDHSNNPINFSFKVPE
ncbi:BACON domain-containing protein [Parabacteroides sp. OttesenSCG-928-G07]|nr:BACON domain-containing protein [Parabacteroides sp. OttesenSCG-928-G21]MDL2277156.1 BACON domain-containing protein [Parabacteroides sp. OttesenSCG-928-G07]